ncbi:MAG: ATP-binding cassette domain-containing protein [Gammaproteobacteria bacterium]|jgi:ABC transport system ATP-binding/permease protein|nr:ATP-binding cassette domain-containing protein [Gammaproteobacteria bacterium]
MLLFRLTDIHLAYGPQVLLEKVSLSIQSGERIGLLGRNGAGKSTFLKLLGQHIKPDGGELWQQQGIKVAFLNQELPAADSQSVYDYVLDGLADAGKLIKQFNHLSLSASDQQSLEKLADIQKQIEVTGAWNIQQKVDSALSKLGVSGETLMNTLSGGWLRRVALAKTFINEPDVLLLDEPTNHLDIPTIEYLEKQLSQFSGPILLITHDRAFLQKIANKIMILDRGEINAWECDYQNFLVFREQQLVAEEKAHAEFDKKLAQEEVWIRQGIKARRTRNEGRVRALKALREEFSQRKKVQGKAKIKLNQAESSGKLVIEAEHIEHSFGESKIINDFSSRIMRGDKIGFIGANGAGKTTLLKILLRELKPSNGKVKIGSKLEIAYFDQLRLQLDPAQNVYDTIAEGSDYVEINGKSLHVMSYLRDFLFTPDRARQKVRSLSGGEQNRLILACLFSKPANLLVLDEPTNDLDMETLELLEELLINFKGTVLLVSHDREFLNNVVTSCIAFEGGEDHGKVKQYVGGYEDWLRQGGSFALDKPRKESETQKISKNSAPKLSYKLKRELEQLPLQIEKCEQEIEKLEKQISQPDFYDQDHEKTNVILEQLSKAQQHLEHYFERWTKIEDEQTT